MFRETEADLSPVVAASHPIRCRVEAWRGGEFLGVVPILPGSMLKEAADQAVPETVEIVAAAVDAGGVSWIPGPSGMDGLDNYGQRLYITYSVGRADGTFVDVQLGWFVLDDWDDNDDGTVSATAFGLLDVIRTAELLAPSSPPVGATFRSELVRLIGGRLPVDLDAAPEDRDVPSSLTWQDSRLDAVTELLSAWPAAGYVDPSGTLVVEPAEPASWAADVTLTAANATVVKRTSAGSRAGRYNVVVARGESQSDVNAPAVWDYAVDDDHRSPTWVDGPQGELVRKFSSPLLTTRSQCQAAARTLLAASLVQSRTIPVECIPDPRIGVGTRVDYLNDAGALLRTVVVASELPLTPDGGAQSLTLGTV